MQGTQLELSFEAAVQAAMEKPETASLEALWMELEQLLTGLPDGVQLQVAGQAISQVADVLEAKAESWFEAWEMVHNPPNLTEPMLTTEMLSGVLRQSMSLDLEGVLQEPPAREPRSTNESIQSMVSEVDKDDLLQVLNEEAKHKAACQQALALAHEENISAWTGAITQYLKRQSLSSIRLSELRQALPMSLIELWLGLLLGGYHLEAEIADHSEQSTSEEKLVTKQHCFRTPDECFYHSEILIHQMLV